MSVLDYVVEPLVDCPNTDVNDAVFVWATTIRSEAVTPSKTFWREGCTPSRLVSASRA
jgi:hypothetical protein